MRTQTALVKRCKGKAADQGVSLILVMLAMLVLSVLAATIVFTARSETLASYNYKLDTQADYLAKAGIQQAITWLRSARYTAVSQSNANTYYSVASTGTPYNLWVSKSAPVQCISGCSSTGPGSNQVQLIGYGGGSSNYPFSGTITNFTSDLVNQQVAGDANNAGKFSVDMYLLSYQTVSQGTPPAINRLPMETWRITSKATWSGTSSSSATVAVAEEEAIIEPIYTPTWGNALYGYCSVSMTGSAGVCTDAFNSALGAYGANATAAKGCDWNASNVLKAGAGVGANGGITLGSNVTVSGDVTIGTGPSAGCTATPGCTGCTSTNVLGAVMSGPHINPPSVATFQAGFPTGASNVSSGTIPQTGSGTPPPANTTINPGGSTYTKPCATGYTCDGSAANPYLINSLGGATLVGGPDIFNPVYYDIDSINISGTTQITVVGYVVWNVKTTLSLTGQGITNTLSNAPETCQINFAGTSASLGGNGAMTAIVTAPLATVTLGGGGSKGYMVGAIRADSVSFSGGYPLHYDVQLSRAGGVLGKMVTTAYTRKKM